MEALLRPFFVYYWLFALLLPVARWVIGGGLALIIVGILRFTVLRMVLLTLPPLVHRTTLAVALLGAVGTMPTSFLYGAVGAELGATLGKVAEDGLWFPGLGLGRIGQTILGTISVLSLVAWALLLWTIVGAAIGWGLNAATKSLRGFRHSQ